MALAQSSWGKPGWGLIWWLRMSQGMRSLVFTVFHPNQDWQRFSQNASFRYANPDNCGRHHKLPTRAVRSSLLVQTTFFRDTVVNVAGGTVRAVAVG